MKEAPKIQEIVAQIGEKHGVDLAKPGSHLRLDLQGHGQLVIENIGGGRVSVTNYIQVNESWIADPQIVLYVGVRSGEGAEDAPQEAWFPVEVNELFGGWRLYAEPDLCGDLVLYDAVGQAALADYAEQAVAGSLAAHGWLEQGERADTGVALWTPAEILARDIRPDEVWLPDEEQSYGRT